MEKLKGLFGISETIFRGEALSIIQAMNMTMNVKDWDEVRGSATQ